MQKAIEEMLTLGRMPDESIDDPSDAVVERWQRLIEEITLPVTQEEAAALLTLFPEEELYGLAWNLMQAVESLLPDIASPAEYRALIQTCISKAWREAMEIRLNNWEKKENGNA